MLVHGGPFRIITIGCLAPTWLVRISLPAIVLVSFRRSSRLGRQGMFLLRAPARQILSSEASPLTLALVRATFSPRRVTAQGVTTSLKLPSCGIRSPPMHVGYWLSRFPPVKLPRTKWTILPRKAVAFIVGLRTRIWLHLICLLPHPPAGRFATGLARNAWRP